MGMFTVLSHEYDEANNIDIYELKPGFGKTMIRTLTKEDGTPEVLLGVAGMTHQMASGDAAESMSWTNCANKDLLEIALNDWKARQ